MREFYHLLKYKILIFLKINTSLSVGSLLKNVGSFIVYSSFVAGTFLFTKSILEFLLNHIHMGSYLLHRFIFVILYIFFLVVNVGNIVVSYATLYKSDEVNYLFTKPVSYSTVFVIKFLDNFFYSSATLMLIICAVAAGYGVYFGLDAGFYLTTIFLIILPFMLSAASLGVILLMVIVKLSGRFGVRNILIVLLLIYVFLLILFFRISDPVHIVNEVMAYYPYTDRYYGFLDSQVFNYLPNFWASDALYWMSSGNFSKAVIDILLQIGTSVILFSSAVFLGSKWYYATWKESLRFTFGRSKDKLRKKPFRERPYPEPQFGSQTGALIKKEFMQFLREPSQWIHAVVMLVLIIIFLVSLRGIDLGLFTSSNITLMTVTYLVVFLFNAFLISSLSLRFVFPLISLEGQSYWKIKSAPVRNIKLIAVKFLIYFSIIFITGQAINFFSQNKFPAELSQTASINTAFIIIALVTLNFGMGGVFSDFKEKNPIRIASSQGAAITFLITLSYLVFLIIVLFMPVYNFYNLKSDVAGIGYSLLYRTNLIIGAVSVLITVLSLIISMKSLKRDF